MLALNIHKIKLKVTVVGPDVFWLLDIGSKS